MAYCTVSIAGAQNDSRFGKSQFPIKSFIEKKGEGFEQQSLLKHLFRMDTSKNFGEKYTGDTAMDDFEPVGEGGNYPETGTMESYAQTLEHMTWKSRFTVTREMVDDNKIGDMRKKASKFITAYDRTREKFGRALYVGGLTGTTVTYGGNYHLYALVPAGFQVPDRPGRGRVPGPHEAGRDLRGRQQQRQQPVERVRSVHRRFRGLAVRFGGRRDRRQRTVTEKHLTDKRPGETALPGVFGKELRLKFD